MKSRVNLRTKLNFEAEEKRLHHIKQHVAKLKAEHDSRTDFDFGTKGTFMNSLAPVMGAQLELIIAPVP